MLPLLSWLGSWQVPSVPCPTSLKKVGVLGKGRSLHGTSKLVISGGQLEGGLAWEGARRVRDLSPLPFPEWSCDPTSGR